MITKAIVKKLCTNNDNHFSVYIPLLRKANADESDATLQATLMSIPGLENTLNVGDVVYVSFEDDNYNTPIILGNLYIKQKDKKDITTTLTTKSLEVTEVNKSPSNTIIGDINVEKLQKALGVLEDINHFESKDIIYSNDQLTSNNVEEALDSLVNMAYHGLDIEVNDEILTFTTEEPPNDDD